MNITTKKVAVQFTHTLSNPSKMPCKGTSLPTSVCNVGGKLRDVPGSVCHGCYADKGCYQWNSSQNAMRLRLEGIAKPEWVEAMSVMIGTDKYFRWHDSGDLVNYKHLLKIVAVCKNSPDTMHWLPTKEKGLIRKYLRKNGAFPSNMVIRLSGAMFDGPAPSGHGVNTSTSHDKGAPIGYECKAYRTFKNGDMLTRAKFDKLERGHGLDLGHCGDCRACWNSKVANVSYWKH